MGVLGLTPFLQRYYPSVVKSLPNRLESFSGKTLVFDGTLITHRFHFAPFPHKYRHVLGWYRLITELRENNVNAICVFDGVGRTDAKLIEHEKRANSRRLDLARCHIETERYKRLRAIRDLIDESRWLPMEQRMLAIAKLEEMLKGKRKKSKETVPAQPDLEWEEGIESQRVILQSSSEEFEYDADILPEHEDQAVPLVDFSGSESISLASEPVIEDRDFLYPDDRPPPSAQYDFYEELDSLYASHEALARTIRDMAPLDDASVVSSEEVTESRKQLHLSYDEDLLWNKLQSLIAQPRFLRFLRTPPLLASLIKRSKALSESYKLRASPPTEETYTECKMMIEALGVPCIEARGEFEAEGLAAALVRRGLADYVASEDTDVLLYGAPLLRNVSVRGGPIISISSEEVRRALSLSRAAFMDFALLIGTDFVPRLRNVGPVRALGFIYEHSRIERVVKNESRYVPEDIPSYLNQIRRARKIFTKLPPVPPKSKLQPGEVDKERVTELLDHFGLARVVNEGDWDPDTALAGNYYNDNPNDEGVPNSVSGMRFVK